MQTEAAATRSDIAALQEKILAFAAERDWQQFHDPKNLAMAVAVEAGKLLAGPFEPSCLNLAISKRRFQSGCGGTLLISRVTVYT
jgi:hypothetical protein